ncbi:MAG TPA: HEAT repeat domain-containing protein [Planctomycetes bacterium]|nr:HEAT repeat domain-containing protein [Planctomycetota bacterium]
MRPNQGTQTLLLALLLGAAAPASLSSQKVKTPPPKDNPQVAVLEKSLKEIVADKKGRKDDEGVKILDNFTKLFPKLNKKQQGSLLKATAHVFRARRTPQNALLFFAGSETLGHFGKEGAKELAKLVQNKTFRNRDWTPLRVHLIKQLGKAAETSYVKLLLDLALRDKEDQVRGAAGEALGNYSRKDQKLRKLIVGKLIKEMNAIYNVSRANLDPTDLLRKVYVDRFKAIQDPWMKTLTKLTTQNFRTPLEWEQWFNKYKRKNWDRLGFGPKVGKGKKTKGA